MMANEQPDMQIIQVKHNAKFKYIKRNLGLIKMKKLNNFTEESYKKKCHTWICSLQ